MLRAAKQAFLGMGRRARLFDAVARSRWRQDRLLILCYHGVSVQDEHCWSPMYVTADFFRRRMEIIASSGYRVLPLSVAVEMLLKRSLPSKAVVITFDDGFHDFYQQAFPLLRGFGFAATVYQTTYYCDHPFPIFNLVLRYVLWRGAGHHLQGADFDIPGEFDLSSIEDRRRAIKAFRAFTHENRYTPEQRDTLAAAVSKSLGVDYAEIRRKRMLQLMNADELQEISAAGIDLELHTHRHRAPYNERLFAREIQDNRDWLAAQTGVRAAHFCYPSGVCRSDFLPWLRAEGIVSATTCDCGLAERATDPLLLPRLLDSMNIPEREFEGWLTGFRSLLPLRVSATKYSDESL